MNYYELNGIILSAMHVDHLSLQLESILERQLSLGRSNFNIVGTSSRFVAATQIAQQNISYYKLLPHLVVVSCFEEALAMEKELLLLEPNCRVFTLPHFDVSPYSALVPSRQTSAKRIAWLSAAQSARPGDVFIAPIQSLQQKTLPFLALANYTLVLKVGNEVPSDFASFLAKIGYSASPYVEDLGHFAQRGGILDVFSPAHKHPVRIELFGDTIESLRSFSTEDHRSLESLDSISILPVHESLYTDAFFESTIHAAQKSLLERAVDKGEAQELLRELSQQHYFASVDFLLPFFYKKLDCPLEHFSTALNIWLVDGIAIAQQSDLYFEELKSNFASSAHHAIRPEVDSLFFSFDEIVIDESSRTFCLSDIPAEELGHFLPPAHESVEYRTFSTTDLSSGLKGLVPGGEAWLKVIQEKFSNWKHSGYQIFIFGRNSNQSERLKVLLEKAGFTALITNENELRWGEWASQQNANDKLTHIIPRFSQQSLRLADDRIIFLRDEDFFGAKTRMAKKSDSAQFQEAAQRLSFGDLNPGDYIVHINHGIGQYDGLRVMTIGGVDSEFIQLAFKDGDKLYLPIYRIGQLQKYAGPSAVVSLDKLGGSSWEKTKIKVRSHLKDIAAELLNLYAQRANISRPSFSPPDRDYLAFEAAFPYDETTDQLKAISDILTDMTKSTPMDRLVCGDVGFGKTEVAMRAAFKCIEDKKQVAVLAPTTVLTFQHAETFKKRFAGWPVNIKTLNRFVSSTEIKKTLAEAREGKVDILIGTHRLLSKDVSFSNLGLLIIDEEQKFGVAHKERIRKLRTHVDTIALSATPIPRTLNMSLVGIRDLSLITTPPMDRLPTRTFISKFEPETIRKAVEAEISRGGQIYFIHNRVQSIYGLADELRALLPNVRMRVAHGQMDEGELESAMIAFFNHEIDMLVCTAIVESGMDVPNANTMFIDSAHIFGLSQLYQLRGRVGRSKHRAYCYLLLPKGKVLDKQAEERLKVIQENTALGSGIRVAQYDLELRGAGNLLGEEQSGHVNAVGYELYMDLLNETLHELKGEPLTPDIDPEINLRIPALIPDSYISDIRIRLSYYKALSSINSADELSGIEDELRDQFGAPPDAVMNLMGIMLIRNTCKQLGIKDLSAGVKNISLVMSDRTPLKPETIVRLATRENKKYSVTPDFRLNIRMNAISIQGVYEELNYLLTLL